MRPSPTPNEARLTFTANAAGETIRGREGKRKSKGYRKRCRRDKGMTGMVGKEKGRENERERGIEDCRDGGR